MHRHLTGAEFAAWAAIAVVIACALGLALAAITSSRAVRRAERGRQ